MSRSIQNSYAVVQNDQKQALRCRRKLLVTSQQIYIVQLWCQIYESLQGALLRIEPNEARFPIVSRITNVI